MATLFICALAGWRLPLFHWRWVIVSSWPFLGSSHFSRRVYVRSLCCEYRASFIMKLELMIITKILYQDPPWKRDEGERGNGLFIVQEISITYILTLQCIICDFWNLESDTTQRNIGALSWFKNSRLYEDCGGIVEAFPTPWSCRHYFADGPTGKA